MNQEDVLTTEEVAKLLKVSKLTVYDLIKKDILPSYRVGRQFRVERAALEAYKNQGITQGSKQTTTITNKESHDPASIIITGQDQSLDILAKELEKRDPTRRLLRSHTGSMNGLMNMYDQKANIVSAHLYDSDTDTYNIPYVRKILVSQPFIVIRLLKREAGFFVQTGNPKQITSWKDFHDKQLTMINREQGAGARVLLDEKLRKHNISPSTVTGYQDELTSHMDIANAIATGKADVGIGTKNASKMIDIDFISMIEEDYDLVIQATPENNMLINAVKEITNEPAFKSMLNNIGYNTEETGTVIFEQT